jgi:hypothetical protein
LTLEHPTAIETVDPALLPLPEIYHWEIKRVPGAYGKAVVTSSNRDGQPLRLAYTVNFIQAGEYKIYLRGTGNQNHNHVVLYFDSNCLSCGIMDSGISFFIPSQYSTYSTYFWNWVSVRAGQIQPGMHTLYLYMVSEGVAVDQIFITQMDQSIVADNMRESRLVKRIAYTPHQHDVTDMLTYWVVDQTGGIASASVTLINELPTTTASIPTSTSEQTAAPVMEESSEDDTVLWIIIGVGALLVCVLIVVVVIFIRKRANRRQQHNSSMQSIEMQQQVVNRIAFNIEIFNRKRVTPPFL